MLTFLLRKGAAYLKRARRVDGRIALFYVLDYALLVHNERRARGEALLFIVDSVGLRNCALEIAEEGKLDADLFGECSVGGEGVNADAQNLRFACVEFGDIRLIRL